ncbi:hypothetical protein MF271_23030 (plasmid) [Deinococcus sp. KNUC1210]|uniref:hypothetical protein n=1 Tax=Deinococcus sp. KNUC1210 TaxID=2917691 RepID=UPI001EF04E25|nr:hypothetical protein [Deinococcus sp. KNUC1210]ULH18335.1 hypothetical protein MF271_23030 [Deinococcus sp. KNUC1210]
MTFLTSCFLILALLLLQAKQGEVRHPRRHPLDTLLSSLPTVPGAGFISVLIGTDQLARLTVFVC